MQEQDLNKQQFRLSIGGLIGIVMTVISVLIGINEKLNSELSGVRSDMNREIELLRNEVLKEDVYIRKEIEDVKGDGEKRQEWMNQRMDRKVKNHEAIYHKKQ